MNYYPHHIGDYITATAHLSMIEDGAYRRLLDLYYSTEKPLPVDRKALYRLARARATEEQEAINIVLEEFFEQDEDGWIHSRCDEEIAKAKEKGTEAEARKENERERQKRHRQRRAEMFEQLRQHGIVPPWDTSTSELQDMLSRLPSHGTTAPVTKAVTPPVTPVTRTATANQEPITNNQTKEKEIAAAATTPPRTHVHAPAREAAPDAPPSPGEGQRPETRYALLIRQWEKARSKAPKVTSSDPRLTVWAEKGVTADQLQEAYELAVADRDKTNDPGPINAGFLDTCLAKVLNPKGGDSALNRPGATGNAKPWQASWSGIEAKAEELGIKQVSGEHPQVFKARVFAAAGVTDEDRARLRADFGVTV